MGSFAFLITFEALSPCASCFSHATFCQRTASVCQAYRANLLIHTQHASATSRVFLSPKYACSGQDFGETISDSLAPIETAGLLSAVGAGSELILLGTPQPRWGVCIRIVVNVLFEAAIDVFLNTRAAMHGIRSPEVVIVTSRSNQVEIIATCLLTVARIAEGMLIADIIHKT